jgi:TonB family protein
MATRLAVALCLFCVVPAASQTLTSDDVKQLQSAAEKGDAKAQIELGLAYENGTGVPVDKPLALQWYQKAADRGQHMAAFSAGLLLYGATDKGEEGIKQDLVGAWKWLDIAIAWAPEMERPIYERARDDAAKKMKPAEIADAQRQSREWMNAFRQRPAPPGMDVTDPVRTTYVAPDYPKSAVKSKAQGDVRLEIVVGTDGKVRTAKVLSSPAGILDEPAIAAVKQWEFQPARFKGEPIAVTLTVTLSFTLVKEHSLSGFRSVVAYVRHASTPSVLAVGPQGSDFSTDDGRTWTAVPGPGFHTFSSSPSGNVDWGAGNRGAIGRLAMDGR